MSQNREMFDYNQSMDTQVPGAVEEVLGVPVLKSSRIEQGEYNYVYKIESQKEKYILRVFRTSDYPDAEDLNWTNEKLTEAQIPHAKIFKITRDSKFFPAGFMITEFIEGEICHDAIENKKINFEEYCQKVGALLGKVHSIELKKFGLVNHGEGEYLDVIQHLLEDMDQIIDEVSQLVGLNDPIKEKVLAAVNILEKYRERIKPVLTHGDANSDNGILTRDGNVTLIDWDNARADIALFDFATLIYWRMKPPKHLTIKEYRSKLQDAYFSHYGKTEFDTDETNEIVRVLQIVKSVRLLSYYHHIQKRQESVDDTKKKLLSLLSEF